MKRQQAAGKIRFLGITEQFGGDTGHAMLPRALADDHFDVIMVGFNLVNPSARERVFPLTRAHDVGTLIMFAVRRQLSDPAALREAVAGLIARGEVDGGQVDAADPLGFLRDARRDRLGGRGRLPLLPPRAGRARDPDRHRRCRPPGSQPRRHPGPGALPADVLERLTRLFGKVDSVSGN